MEWTATADEAGARVDTWLNKELANPTISIAFLKRFRLQLNIHANFLQSRFPF